MLKFKEVYAKTFLTDENERRIKLTFICLDRQENKQPFSCVLNKGDAIAIITKLLHKLVKAERLEKDFERRFEK